MNNDPYAAIRRGGLTDLGPMFQKLAQTMGSSDGSRENPPLQPIQPDPINRGGNLPKMPGPTEPGAPYVWGTPPAFEGNDQIFDPASGLGGGNLSGDVISHDSPNMPNWTPVKGFEGDLQTGKPFTNVQGFDYGKLIDPNKNNAKYTPALRKFSEAINGLDPTDPSSTPRAIAYLKSNGFPNVTAISDDKWDFGDGNGPIDVKIDSGKGGWWFQNGADRIGGGIPTGGGPDIPGNTTGFQEPGGSTRQPLPAPTTGIPGVPGATPGTIPGLGLPTGGSANTFDLSSLTAPINRPAQPANPSQPMSPDIEAIIAMALRQALGG